MIGLAGCIQVKFFLNFFLSNPVFFVFIIWLLIIYLLF